MKYENLGQNIQTIRKMRNMKQKELAEAIDINLQSLSKIERGLNYPTYYTLEKIMDVLDATPNEILFGDFTTPKANQAFMQLVDQQSLFHATFKNEEESATHLRNMIECFIHDENTELDDLYACVNYIQYIRFSKAIK